LLEHKHRCNPLYQWFTTMFIYKAIIYNNLLIQTARLAKATL